MHILRRKIAFARFLFGFFLAGTCLTSAPAASADIKTITLMTDEAQHLCLIPGSTGNTHEIRGGAQIDVSLSQLLKKLASVGANVSLRGSEAEYSNVMQADLAKERSSYRECVERVFNEMLSHLDFNAPRVGPQPKPTKQDHILQRVNIPTAVDPTGIWEGRWDNHYFVRFVVVKAESSYTVLYQWEETFGQPYVSDTFSAGMVKDVLDGGDIGIVFLHDVTLAYGKFDTPRTAYLHKVLLP